jgi:cytosine/adenosine deaminase-related metal-dependent hydrolase
VIVLGCQPVSFVNAVVVAGDGRLARSLRVCRGSIQSIDAPPQRGDHIIDLEERVVMPGLINAHDHLELNSFPRMKWRARYDNVREWIADFQPRFSTDPALAVPGRAPWWRWS